MSRHVAVIMGGRSAEREVSLVSGRACAEALERQGFRVSALDLEDDVAGLVAALTADRPDVVFNALHGRWGEDGCLQGLLEWLRLPYTHSGVLASALAMDKEAARRAFAAAGLPVAEGRVVSRAEALAGDVLPRPYVIKPVHEGSSVGVHIVWPDDATAPFDADEEASLGHDVLVERFIPGRELTVAVMGDRALGVTEIRPRQGFYDYQTKYTGGLADHLCPAPLDGAVAARTQMIALEAHKALGCRGVTRADFRYDDTAGGPGELILLEINTQPGMTPLSLVPEQAAAAGISFDDLVTWMVEAATWDA